MFIKWTNCTMRDYSEGNTRTLWCFFPLRLFYLCRFKISWIINPWEEVNKREVFQCLKLILLFSVNIVNRRYNNWFYEIQSSLSLSSVTNSAYFFKTFFQLQVSLDEIILPSVQPRTRLYVPTIPGSMRLCVRPVVSPLVSAKRPIDHFSRVITQWHNISPTHTHITTRRGNYSATGEIRIQMYLS